MQAFGTDKSSEALTQLILGMSDQSAAAASEFLRGVLPLVAPPAAPAPALDDTYDDDGVVFDYFKEDAAKRAVRATGRREGVHTHVGCSLFAAACAAVLSLPPDMILNRYQGAPVRGL